MSANHDHDDSRRPEACSHIERQRGAMAYIAKSFGRDPEPIRMVTAILAGERDDVVRSLMGRRAA